MTARRHNGVTATPPAPKPSKYTLLLDQDDALALDELAFQMRREAGRPVDKAEMMRLLIRLARDHAEVSAFLSRRVRRD
ncbi:hypothetical protein AB0N79_38820 [Streptomyces microflavus]|uniref:hypothetical protein n=1 Tax=Streptomyces microflavus TaxID=1919 RepID=UPI00342556DF